MTDKTIRVHVGAKRAPVVVPLAQYDDAWRFRFRVYNGDERFTLAGHTVQFVGRKPDGNVFAVSGTVSGNEAIVPADIQMTACPGPVDCELRIFDGDGKSVATSKLVFEVKQSPVGDDSVVSDTALSAFEQLEETAQAAEAAAAAAAASAQQAADDAQSVVQAAIDLPYVNVLYPTVDGTALSPLTPGDDTKGTANVAALQGIIDACHTAQHGAVIYFPPGRYYLDGTVNVTMRWLKFTCEAQNAAVLVPLTEPVEGVIPPLFNVQPAAGDTLPNNFVEFFGLYFQSKNTAIWRGTVFVCRSRDGAGGPDYFTLRHVQTQRIMTLLDADKATGILLDDCTYAHTGLSTDTDVNPATNYQDVTALRFTGETPSVQIRNCHLNAIAIPSLRNAVGIDGVVADFFMYNTSFRGWDICIDVNGAEAVGLSGDVHISGCLFDFFKGTAVKITGYSPHEHESGALLHTAYLVTDCYFTSAASEAFKYAVWIAHARNVTVKGCMSGACNGDVKHHDILVARSTDVVIEANQLYNLPTAVTPQSGTATTSHAVQIQNNGATAIDDMFVTVANNVFRCDHIDKTATGTTFADDSALNIFGNMRVSVVGNQFAGSSAGKYINVQSGTVTGVVTANLFRDTAAARITAGGLTLANNA